MSVVYVGIDVHEETFSFASLRLDDLGDEMKEPDGTGNIFFAEAKMNSGVNSVLKYVNSLRSKLKVYDYDELKIVLGYEAGCLGYEPYRQMTKAGLECRILAPSTMPTARGGKKIKNDRRDAREIARCLAWSLCSYVKPLDPEDEETRDYIRMRDDHKTQIKHIKQQILAFCLRHDKHFKGTNWAGPHLKWLKSVELPKMLREVLDEYLNTLSQLTEKLKAMDTRIEGLAQQERYRENVSKLVCFGGIKTHTALSLLCEVGDFKRFETADRFSSYLGLIPGEDSSGDKVRHTGITKSGNRHLRRLLTESAQSYGRMSAKGKSAALRLRQQGQSKSVINYADKGTERLRRRFYRLVAQGKPHNVVVAATARELSCFVWGMMTGNYDQTIEQTA